MKGVDTLFTTVVVVAVVTRNQAKMINPAGALLGWKLFPCYPDYHRGQLGTMLNWKSMTTPRLIKKKQIRPCAI